MDCSFILFLFLFRCTVGPLPALFLSLSLFHSPSIHPSLSAIWKISVCERCFCTLWVIVDCVGISFTVVLSQWHCSWFLHVPVVCFKASNGKFNAFSVSIAEAHRALELLEDYHARLGGSQDRALRIAIERVIRIFKSRLFQALLGESWEANWWGCHQGRGEGMYPVRPKTRSRIRQEQRRNCHNFQFLIEFQLVFKTVF